MLMPFPTYEISLSDIWLVVILSISTLAILGIFRNIVRCHHVCIFCGSWYMTVFVGHPRLELTYRVLFDNHTLMPLAWSTNPGKRQICIFKYHTAAVIMRWMVFIDCWLPGPGIISVFYTAWPPYYAAAPANMLCCVTAVSVRDIFWPCLVYCQLVYCISVLYCWLSILRTPQVKFSLTDMCPVNWMNKHDINCYGPTGT